ncbi:hypothetical protein [Priestia aryabhattai]
MLFKRLHFIFALSIVLLITAGCDPSSTPKDDYYTTTKSTDLSQENIKQIHIGSNKYNVTKVFGKPTSIEVVSQPKSEYYAYGESKDNSGIEFKLINNKVASYLLYSNKYKTTKGVAVGSSKKDVLRSYGENYYKRNDTGEKVFGYFDKTNNINIEFDIRDNEVIGIHLSRFKKTDK